MRTYRNRPTPVTLAGSNVDNGLLRVCMRCSANVSPAGGVQMTPARWICSSCWKGRLLSKAMKARNTARAA